MERMFTSREMNIICTTVAEIAVTNVLGRLGVIKPYMSRQEANRVYGRSNVDRWLSAKLITKRQKGTGNQWRLNRAELEAAAASEIKISSITSVVK